MFTFLYFQKAKSFNTSPVRWTEVSYSDALGFHKEHIVWGSDWGQFHKEHGDYSCMGRCGVGCYKSSDLIKETWSYSCLAHDLCSYRNHSHYGPFDPNCGDEFVRAFLDNAFTILIGIVFG